MKTRLLALVMGAFSICAGAQTATVTGTATDSDGQTWNNGSWSATLISPNGGPTINRVPVSPVNVSGSFNGSGVLSTTLTRTDALDQGGAYWQFTICPNASVACARPVTTTIAAGTVSVSSVLSSGLAGPRFPPGQNSYGYLDVEVVPLPPATPDGSIYFNVTNGVMRSYSAKTQTWGGSGGGGGTTVSVNGATVSTPNFKNSTGAGGITFGVAGSDVTPTLTNTTITVNGNSCALGSSCTVATANYTNDLIVAYDFTETGRTAGQTLPDHSGNGNDGVIGSTPPIQDGFGWRGTGTDNNAVSLPTAVDTARSFSFMAYDPPPLPGGYTGNNEVYFGASTTAGMSAVGYVCCSLAQQSFYALWQFNGATTNGSTTIQYGNGPRIWTIVCSATPVIYVNGVALAASAYTARVSCQTQTAPIFYKLFSSASFTGGTYAKLSKFIASNSVWTQAQVEQNYAAMVNELSGRGVTLAPRPYIYPRRRIIVAGDSIPCGATLSGCTPQPDPYTTGSTSSLAWPSQLSLSHPYDLLNYAVPSALAQQQMASADFSYVQQCSTQDAFSLVLSAEASNNYVFSAWANPTTVNDTNTALLSKVRRGGCQGILIGMISRSGSPCYTGGPTSCDGYKSQNDALQRATWKQNNWMSYVDVEAFTAFGINGSYSTCTTDGIHPNAGCQAAIAAAVSQHINYVYDGSTPANPNPTVVTSTPYASVVLDGGLNFDTSAGAIVDTLFSATGWSGRVIKRCNIAPSGSNTLTVTAPSDFPFNNKTGALTVVLNPGSCASFQSTFISSTTGGDFWATI